MKRYWKILILGFVIVLLSACAAGNTGGNSGSNNGEEAVELVYNTWMGSTYYIATGYVDPWTKEVEERSNGKITFNMNYGGVLGEAPSHYDDLSAGRYEITLGYPTYLNNDDLYPLTITELPFAIVDPVKGQKVVEEFWKLHGQEAYGDKIETGTPSQTSAYYIHSTKPINSIDDLRGMKIGSIDDTWVPVTKEWGATPMLITIPDIYPNLERGTLDAVIYSDRGSLSLSMAEVAPYVVKLPMNTLLQLPLINTNALNKMPEDLRKTFTDDLLPLQAEIYLEFYKKDSVETWDKIEESVTKAGGEVIILSPEEERKIRETAEVAWDEWVDEANKRGLDGDTMMADFRRLMEEAGLELPY
jgi:TRAP-type transport system periplasmic protein